MLGDGFYVCLKHIGYSLCGNPVVIFHDTQNINASMVRRPLEIPLQLHRCFHAPILPHCGKHSNILQNVGMLNLCDTGMLYLWYNGNVMNLSFIGNDATLILGGIAFLALAAFIVVSFILDYHLRRYITSAMRPMVAFARLIYVGVSLIAVSMIVLLTLSLFSSR